MDDKKRILRNDNDSIFAGSDLLMKKSPSELALQELVALADHHEEEQEEDKIIKTVGSSQEAGSCCYFAFENCGGGGNNSGHFPFRNTDFQEITKRLPSSTMLAANQSFWTQNLSCPVQSKVSVTNDSQSSICVDSPASANNLTSKANHGASSVSSQEQSDEDDQEVEAGSCEQSTNTVDIKRIRRMVSNRESARRSRRRKQAQLADLEKQVEQLTSENGTLFKQLADATQQFKDATTNNRVLKSDVEALRAKVKLGEDLLARGSISMTSSLCHIMQNYLNTPQDYISNNNMNHADHHFSPILSDSNNGVENGETFSSNASDNRVWMWDANVSPPSK